MGATFRRPGRSERRRRRRKRRRTFQNLLETSGEHLGPLTEKTSKEPFRVLQKHLRIQLRNLLKESRTLYISSLFFYQFNFFQCKKENVTKKGKMLLYFVFFTTCHGLLGPFHQLKYFFTISSQLWSTVTFTVHSAHSHNFLGHFFIGSFDFKGT